MRAVFLLCLSPPPHSSPICVGFLTDINKRGKCLTTLHFEFFKNSQVWGKRVKSWILDVWNISQSSHWVMVKWRFWNYCCTCDLMKGKRKHSKIKNQTHITHITKSYQQGSSCPHCVQGTQNSLPSDGCFRPGRCHSQRVSKWSFSYVPNAYQILGFWFLGEYT